MPVGNAGPTYAVPFFRNNDLWQGFWSYVHNLRTADRFDWENTEDLLKDYFEKEDFVLERIPRIVSFLSKVGDKRFRVKLGPDHNPTKDFCEKFASVLEASPLSETFHYRLAYEYVANTKIKHEWIGYIFEYKGPYKKTVLRALSDALVDHYIDDPYTKYPTEKLETNYRKLFVPLYKRINNPEDLPIPLYKAILCCRKVDHIKRWTVFVKNNVDAGRTDEERSKATRFLIINAIRVARARHVFDAETRNEALNSLLITRDSSEKEYQAEFIWKILRSSKFKGQYVFFRPYINEEIFQEKYKKIMLKKNTCFRFFVRAYEGDDSVFHRLSFEEQLILYNRLQKHRKVTVLERAKRFFLSSVGWKEHRDVLYFALRVISLGDNEFLKKHIFDPRLEKSSFLSKRLRTFYLVKLHLIGYAKVFKRHLHFFLLKIISTRLEIMDAYLDRL